MKPQFRTRLFSLLLSAALLIAGAVPVAVLIRRYMQEPRVDTSSMVKLSGYFAGDPSDRYPVDFSCYFRSDKPPFDIGDIQGIWFDGLEESVRLSDVRAGLVDGVGRYSRYDISAYIEPVEQGLFASDHLIVRLHDGRSFRYPLGQWTFDIGPTGGHSLPLEWSTPGQSGDPAAFLYELRPVDSMSKVSIQVGPKTVISGDPVSLAQADRIVFDNQAPVTLIRPKIVVEQDGQAVTYYGDGSVCGGGQADSLSALEQILAPPCSLIKEDAR